MLKQLASAREILYAHVPTGSRSGRISEFVSWRVGGGGGIVLRLSDAYGDAIKKQNVRAITVLSCLKPLERLN